MTNKRFCDRCFKEITEQSGTMKYTIKYGGLWSKLGELEQDLCAECTNDFVKFVLEAKGWEKIE